jgi:class 3 adenylate cyclase/pimeloyl-ACP methyl ester carboxylesterase
VPREGERSGAWVAVAGGEAEDGRVTPEIRWAQTIDGASIAYHDVGEGPTTLVLMNGWISHLEVYWDQPRYARFLGRFAKTMRVLTFDKRGVGMSERISRAPDLESRMDDIRAVLDAAGVERAAIFGWGTGAPSLALFFAATHPERTVAVITDGNILDKAAPGYPWGSTDEVHEQWKARLLEHWGTEAGSMDMVRVAFGTDPGHAPTEDGQFMTWLARFARFSATPTSYAAFVDMWRETDIRDVLSAVHVPAAVLYKTRTSDWGSKAQAEYVAERVPGAHVVPVEGSAPVLWIEDPEPLVTAVEKFLYSVKSEEDDLDRVLATVLFTDIVGSTHTAARVGDHAWKQLVERHHSTVRALLARYRGTELDTAGDGFYASFDGPARAVRCAQATVRAMHHAGLEIRAGLHTGEVEFIDGKPGGIAVAIGARIAGAANPSEVLVSQTVKDVVVGSGLAFDDRGEHNLKGVPGGWRLYAAPSPPVT